MTCQSYVVHKTGSIKRLTRLSTTIPKLSDKQALVEVHSIGINYADIFAVLGLYSATPPTPFVPGLEFSGIVLESKDARYAPGQRVMGVTRFGGYTTHVAADADYLMPLPERWSFEHGAAFPVQSLTAYYALKTLGDIQPSQTILIHSAAGGVGLQANRIAKRFDAYTIGVVGDERKLSLLEKEGYDAGIIRNQKTFSSALRDALGGRPLDLVLEASGDFYFKKSYEALAPTGRLVAYGSATFTPSGSRSNYLTLAWKYLTRPKVDPLSMITANKSVMAFNLIWIYEKRDMLRRLIQEIDDLGLPAPFVGHRYQFENLPNALTEMKAGKTVGKLVVNVF
jgi:NADPH:quinone reductase-like Zn-dependent oxidoreductase